MTSILRSWLYGSTASIVEQKDDPAIPSISPPSDDEDEEEGEATETERDYNHNNNDDNDDRPPAFPALNSAQRAPTSSSSSNRPSSTLKLTDAQLMPPPPIPSLAASRQLVQLGVTPTSKGNTLAVPPRTEKPPVKPSRKREKVALAPGFGPLDWAALKSSGTDLRGVDTLMRITPSTLKKHNKPEDAWASFNGKVYNITPYLKFHPGGEKELMRVAGRDGTKLFALTHAWVNVEYMLDSCLVGFLVPESSS